MAEQSQTLYRKWRSQTFGDLVGQDAVTQTLRQAVRDGRLTHAYLFCGPRGTGKTSSARLLAKMVNCESPRDGEPCNECLPCREITEGRSTDVFEIDAASNRGIDEIRDLRDRVRIVGAAGRTRIFIIDEVHMLTTEAFNALLKTLEEPPPRVIFVLATTEAHKVPATVVSRCQRFDFRRIGLRDIMAHLQYVSEQEGFTVEAGAIELIARAAQGGMRDALSLLDQARAFSGETITTVAVRNMLGMADPALVRELIVFVANDDTAAGLHRINELAQGGNDLRQITSQVAEIWRQLMLARAGADIAAMLDLAPEDAADLKTLAGRFTLEALTECARVFARNDAGARSNVVPQLALELSFLDCVAVVHRPAQPQVVTRAEPASIPPQRPAAMHVAEPPPAYPSIAQSSAPLRPPVRDVSDENVAANGNGAPIPIRREQPAPAQPIVPDLAVQPPPLLQGNGTSATVQEAFAKVRNQWDTVKRACKQKSVSVHGLLHAANPVFVEPTDPVTIVVSVDFPIHLSKLSQPQNKKIAEWALGEITGIPCQVRFVLKDEAEALTGMMPPAASGPAPASTRNAASSSAPTPIVSPAEQIQPAPTPPAPAPVPPSPDPRAEAESDPVVRELKREYKARVADIRQAEN